jgi:hypothetical protein
VTEATKGGLERVPGEPVLDLTECPRCRGAKLIAVHAQGVKNFFCEDCTFCWHVNGDGRPTLVDSRSCPGCELSELGWWCA